MTNEIYDKLMLELVQKIAEYEKKGLIDSFLTFKLDPIGCEITRSYVPDGEMYRTLEQTEHVWDNYSPTYNA